MTNQQLVINGVFRTADPKDVLAAAIERRGARPGENSAGIEASRSEILLRVTTLSGLEALRGFFSITAESLPSEATVTLPQGLMDLRALVDVLATTDHGLVMVMGKGGVGKTTIPQPSRLRLPIAVRPST